MLNFKFALGGHYDIIVWVGGWVCWHVCPKAKFDLQCPLMQIHTRKIPLTADVNLATIAACTDCFTGKATLSFDALVVLVPGAGTMQPAAADVECFSD